MQGHASYRGIQACLKELLGHEVSLGTIARLVQEAGEQAQRWLEQQVPEEGRVLALDEQYRSKRGEAYLNVVDAHSGHVWASLPPVAVDGESWTLALWYLREQGVQCQGSVSDGGNAIHEALRTTQLLSTHQRDVWHLLHLFGQTQARLTRLVHAEEARDLVIARQEQHQARTGRRSTGRPTRTSSGEQAHHLIQLHRLQEAVSYLFGQLQDLFEVVVLTGGNQPRLRSHQDRREDVQAALDLLEEAITSAPLSVRSDVQKVIKQVRGALPALVLFAEQLETGQQEALRQQGEATIGLIAWSWQRRKVLGMSPQQLLDAMDPAWRAVAAHLFEAWNQVIRASSVVENWHSMVRPHLAVHRSLSAGMLALLAVCHNHHVAPRGPHAGQSPLQRSGFHQPSGDWLDVLGYVAQTA